MANSAQDLRTADGSRNPEGQPPPPKLRTAGPTAGRILIPGRSCNSCDPVRGLCGDELRQPQGGVRLLAQQHRHGMAQ
jgi:hypothetical protein